MTRIPVLRTERQIRQYLLAARAGLTRHRLWKIETRRSTPTRAESRAIAKALKVTIDALGL